MTEKENAKASGTRTTAAVAAGGAPGSIIQQDVVHVGIDLGTNTTVVAASVNGQPLRLEDDLCRSVVGFPKAGIIPGILPSDTDALFGDEALKFRLHLDLKWPLKEGFVDDVEVCELFCAHVRRLVDPKGKLHLQGVVGSPANASAPRLKDIRRAMRGFLERLLIVPEPFLAAMGLREDDGFRKLGQESDPTKHSLIVDIGAGTTDLCLVRGYYPTADDQISFNKAGDFIDESITKSIQRRFPDLNLTRVTVTKMKEDHSFVPGFSRDAKVKVYVDGRPRTIDFGEIIQEACDQLVPPIVKGIKDLLQRCDSDSIVEVMQNIIVTGGGSQIQGLAQRIQDVLRAEDYDCARTIMPADYKRLVARGGLKIAESVRENQWQVPM